MGRGGDTRDKAAAAGKKVGRPPKKVLSKIRKDVAFEVLDVINQGKSELNPTGRNEVKRWIEFLDSRTEAIAIRALEALKHSVDGVPKQKIETAFDPDQPMRVVVEHIGRPQDRPKHSATAEAKSTR